MGSTVRSQSKFASAGSTGSKDSDDEDAWKYELQDNCKLEILKLNRIEKLEEDYVLVAHPFPQMEGEMLLF